MADIFIAYASQDEDRVAPLVKAFEQHGWQVWWDPEIKPGKIFDTVIEEELDKASAVVSVWTENSVASNWVRTEAAEGAAREILVPIRLEDVRIPLAFRRTQTANLTDWESGQNHEEYAGMISALEVLIGTAQVGEAASSAEPEDPIQQEVSTDKARLAEIDDVVATAEASAAEKEWEAVVNVLGLLEEELPGFKAEYPEAAELLTLARQRYADELYELAEVQYVEGRWSNVLTQLDQIRALDPEIEYGSELRAKAKVYEETETAVSYLTLRRLIGGLGLLFPTTLVIGDLILGESTTLLNSISDYYATSMQPFFVGALITLGIFLFLYRGYNPVFEKNRGENRALGGRFGEISEAVFDKVPYGTSDNIVANLAGSFALGFALFSTTSDIGWVRAVHSVSAAGLFLTLSYFSLFLFTMTKKGVEPTPEKKIRNQGYRTLGVIMLACIVLIAGSNTLLDETIIAAIKPVLWLESAAFWAFGMSWIVKGDTLFKDVG
ncbi:MAG: toll/interleukin-1 receptor domain-containing protein [Actinobacteria bacterium]|nr:toll/interleukin-1 receptor domain-containing protein [Actinomycetota bacterium]